MASLINVRLTKGDAASLGFRLQGGKDFGTPLVIQKVNGGSPAERAGLIAGDSVIKINNTDVFNLRHKDAQDVIVRAGPAFEVTVQRGGSTWKPSVIPTGPLHHSAAPTVSPVTKTSLAAGKQENIGAIGTGHNLAAKPFNPQVNGTVNGAPPKIVNNQYNSPLKLYSEESIAETLSAQTEVLSTGALGVNFKKNEKNYDATNSAVFRMLQEAEKEPRSPDHSSETDSGVVTAPLVGVTGLRHVIAPENRPAPANPQLPPGQNICADCERLIVGVFVRIKDKNLHVECFKCSTCGTSLKNVGYYNINNKLYCDVHAKLAARNNPPAPNLVPVTVPPGAPANAIAAALHTHSLTTQSPLSPRGNLAQPFQPGSYSTAPKPFSSVSAPNYSSLPRAAPLSPVVSAPAPSYSPASSTGRSVSNIVWPPPPEEPEVPTACPLYFAPSSHLRVIPKPVRQKCDFDDEESYSEVEEINMAHFQDPGSFCSEEVCSVTTGRRSAMECVETISESLQTQRLVEDVMKNKLSTSPPPLDKDVQIKGIKSEIIASQKCTSCTNVCETRTEQGELKRLCEFKPNTVECALRSQVENAVPQKWESSMVQALRTLPETSDFAQIPQKFSGSAFASALSIAPCEPFMPPPGSSLQAVPLPEETEPYFPPEHPVPSEPKEPQALPEKEESQFAKALKTAPERPFTPVGAAPVRKKMASTDKLLKDLPKPQQKLTMRDALTTASERPYTPISPEILPAVETTETVKVPRQNVQKPLKPATLPSSFQVGGSDQKQQGPKPYPIKFEEHREEKRSDVQKSSTREKHQVERTVEEIIAPEEEQVQGCYPLFKGFSCSFGSKSEHSEFSVEINTSPPLITSRSQTPSVKIVRTGESGEVITKTEESHLEESKKDVKIERQAEEVILKKPLPLASALHKPGALPQYQVNLSENAEADLLLMQKMEAAKIRHEERKTIVQQPTAPPPPPPRPIITIDQPQTFKPVTEDRPPSSTFSPRPRPVTPSMINKPPPTIPYYQSNLVAQEHHAAPINFLDPASPATSRSPSPCPERSSSPFPATASAARPKSPAQGPPPNPLKSSQPLPTARDSRVEIAKQSLTAFIPQHMEAQMYAATAEAQTFVNPPQVCERRQVEDASSHQVIQGESITTSIAQKSHLDHLEQMKKSQSVETSSGGGVQVQRKKVVTEEFEHTQKMLQIEKSVSSCTTKGHPFKDVKNPEVDVQGIIGLHVTNPHHIVSPFLTPGTIAGVPLAAVESQLKEAPQPRQASQLQPRQASQPQPKQAQVPPPPPPRSAAPVKHVPAPAPASPIRHVIAPSGSKPNQSVNKPNLPLPNVGAGGGRQSAAVGVAPKRGRGVLNTSAIGGARVALCASCHSQIRGPFITALGKIWCPDHFVCATPSCRRPLQDLGFVEEQGQLYCEYCFEQYLAPPCSKCNSKVKGDCLKAIGKNFHPECFNCVYCGKLFSNSPFFLEDGNPYCEADWNELFTTKCYACGFPVEAGDRWVEALNNNYHSQCFNCTMCKKNLEGQSFFAKGGRPFCKNHAR